MNMQPKILLIEDEENLKKIIQLNLEMEGFRVHAVAEAPHILDILKNEHVDLVLLDIMLPKLDGISICERIRTNYKDMNIILMSAKSASKDRVHGLQKGASDYIVKPFEWEELLFRINKLFGNNKDKNNDTKRYKFGDNEIDFITQQAINFKQEIIVLTNKENKLLKLLIDNENSIISREKILNLVWNYEVFPNTRTTDNFILKFRKYFEIEPHNPQYFISKRGVGYMFKK